MSTTTTLNIAIYWRDACQAAQHNDIDGIKYFIAQGDPLTCVSDCLQTPAHCAAKSYSLKALKYLLEQKPELQDKKDLCGNNILHLATMSGFLEMVKYLVLERDMDVYEPASVHLGNGAPHMAAETGYLDVLKYFIEVKNVDVNLRNRMGQPIAFAAALKKKLNVIKYLLEERNADMFMTDDNEDNILHISSRIGDLSVPIYLLEEKKLKFDINAKDRFGENVLHLAARHNHLVLVKYFVMEKDANFNARDNIDRTPLHEAAAQGHFEVVKYLMDRGASVFVKDEFGKTPLQVSRDKHVIQYLEQYVPPERKRRSVPELHLIPPVGDTSIQKHIIGKSTHLIGDNNTSLRHLFSSSYVNSFLVLTDALVKYVGRSSYWSAVSPPESIRKRIDPNAVDAVQAFSIFEE